MDTELTALREEVQALQRDSAPFYRDATSLTEEVDRERLDAYSPALRRLVDRYDETLQELDELDGLQQEQYEPVTWAFPDTMTEVYEGDRVFALGRDARDRMRIYCTYDRFVEKFAAAFDTADGPDDLRTELQRTTEDARTGFDTYFSIWDDKFEDWEAVLWAWYAADDTVRDTMAERRRLYDELETTAAAIEDRVDRLGPRLE